VTFARVHNYLRHHARACAGSLGELARAPFATLLTIAVIGITLALPSGLYLLIANLQQVSRGWEASGQISLFLKREVTEAAAQSLAERIRRTPGVARVEHISRAQALAEFRRLSGLGAALDALKENPLPAVLVVHPASGHAGPERLEHLAHELGKRGEVELVQLDLDWVRRLHAMLNLAERAVLLLAVLLGLAVLLITGNTIRLAVLSRRDEIEVVKIVGGTNAFVRRPFLYAGVLQGITGAGAAWVLVTLGLLWLSGPVQELAGLYGSGFRPRGLEAGATAGLLAAGGVLGWLGSRLAVGRHLYQTDPK
jgi:cell division transport system permease protein